MAKWLDKVFKFGYKDQTFADDVHVLMGGKKVVEEAKAKILSHEETAVRKYIIANNSLWIEQIEIGVMLGQVDKAWAEIKIYGLQATIEHLTNLEKDKKCSMQASN